MASGAGLNRWGEFGGVPMISTSGASADSGIIASEAIGFSKWLFQCIPGNSGAFTGYSVTFYGTIDPLAYKLFQAHVKGTSVVVGGTTYSGAALLTALPATSWCAIVAPSTEGSDGGTPDDTQQYWNPITSTGQLLYTPVPFIAVRAVATGSSQTGDLTVLGFAVP